MDLATIQKYYEDYKLYYMVGNVNEGRLIPITNLAATWNIHDNFGVIVSLHIGGELPEIIEFLNHLGYDHTFIQNEIDKGYFSRATLAADNNLQAILDDEIANYNKILNNYFSFPFVDQHQLTQVYDYIIKALEDLRKNTIIPTTLREGKKLQLTSAPSELICSDALMEYNRISYPGNENKSLLKYLMEQPPSFIANVLGNLGIDKINGTIDIFYELAFFLNRLNAPIIHTNRDNISYISSLDIDQLISILMISNAQRYQFAYSLKAYPWGHVYLLYAVLTGNIPPDPYIIRNSFDRYKALVPVEPYKISALAWNFYGPRTTRDRYSSPYKYVAGIKNISPLEAIVLSSSLQDVDQLINENGMVPPPQVQSSIDKFYYFAGAMGSYNTVYTRPAGLQQPGPLTGMEFIDAVNLLLMYTDRELLDAYPIPDIWANRLNLVRLIFENYRGPVWRLLVKDCKNDDTFNVIEDELHGTINKDNKADPTFSYGTYHNYRCYQTSELVASFHEDESGFHFTVPDWINPALNIGRVGSNIEEFSGKSMLQLLDVINSYLEEENADIILKPLIDKINLGLSKLDIIREELANNIKIYESFQEPEKQWATIYLVWLFLFSMWMRFWKGPGHSYPFTTKSPDYCESPIRDEHIILQLFVRDMILERGGTKVAQWAEQLPIIRFDWKKKVDIKIEPQGSLNKMIIKVQEGKECQGIAGDTLSTTAYSLIKHMFNYDTLKLNEFINEWTPQINNLEREVITRQLPVLEEQVKKQPIPERAGLLWKVYNERLQELSKPIVQQEPFDPDKMEYTQHV